MLESIFTIFAQYSGLGINKDKSKIYFNQACHNKDELCSGLGIAEGLFAFRYLGVPYWLGYQDDCQNLIDRFRVKVESWQCKTLSFASRVELMRSVLHKIVLYWLTIFKLLKSVIKVLEKIMANFLWGDKFHHVGWKMLCKLKEEGGIGLRRLSDCSETCIIFSLALLHFRILLVVQVDARGRCW